ncbi:MAG: CRISPR-associated protein Cse4 family [Chlorobi bacterium]|nr:CRISPR-associated protein Cse4 family [Chlorobiota bacterium]
MKVELHLIQNFPPSNLNRDDTGSPKDTEFGGYRRARISSQCLKRSIRLSETFQAELSGNIGRRTKRSAEIIASNLVANHERPEDDARIIANAAIRALIGKTDDDGITSVLFYVGSDELADIAERLNDTWDTLAPLMNAVREAEAAQAAEGGEEKKTKGKKEKGGAEAKTALTDAIAPAAKSFVNSRKDRVGSVDIALFGRMLAEKPELGIDAACQVAHAISTNKVSMEYDYFTAVDDLNPEGSTGAGMIGTVGYNSSCFYRYALIDADQLAKNLGGNRDLAKEGIRAFIRGAIAAIPTGKQNTFAAQTPPSLVLAVVREKGIPCSLANAFEKPVRPDEEQSLVEKSVEKLDNHWGAVADMYGRAGVHPFLKVMDGAGSVKHLGDAVRGSIQDVIDGVMETIERSWAPAGDAAI